MHDRDVGSRDGESEGVKRRYVRRFFVGGPLDGKQMNVLEGKTEYFAACIEVQRPTDVVTSYEPKNVRYTEQVFVDVDMRKRYQTFWRVFVAEGDATTIEEVAHRLRVNRIPGEIR